jgi:hypothetical protein
MIKKHEPQPLNEKMYEDPPEVPDSMKGQHERMVEKGFVPSEPKVEVIEPEHEGNKSLTTSRKSETWNLDE